MIGPSERQQDDGRARGWRESKLVNASDDIKKGGGAKRGQPPHAASTAEELWPVIESYVRKYGHVTYQDLIDHAITALNACVHYQILRVEKPGRFSWGEIPFDRFSEMVARRAKHTEYEHTMRVRKKVQK